MLPEKAINIATGKAQYLLYANPPTILSFLLENTGIAPLPPSKITRTPSTTCIIPTNVISDNMFTLIYDSVLVILDKIPDKILIIPKTAPE